MAVDVILSKVFHPKQKTSLLLLPLYLHAERGPADI
jgi:hypothetical protein